MITVVFKFYKFINFYKNEFLILPIFNEFLWFESAKYLYIINFITLFSVIFIGKEFLIFKNV